jgi:hypothetical protein
MTTTVVKETILSPRFSLKGWDAWIWFKGNWKTIKEVIKVGVPYLISLQIVAGNPFLEGLVTLIGKFILDVGEYFIKEYKKTA